jgi:RNA-binding protein Nova
MSRNNNSNPNSKLSIKFLVSNAIAGSMIGTGGSAIKELIEITEARVTVSSINDVYPGTSERIILISGSQNSVDLAQNLLWDMFALNVSSNGKKNVTWSPRVASQSPGEYDEISVVGKITIPATAGGLLLGRAGSTLRSIAEESGSKVQMTSKEEAMFTQERILNISGNTGSCAKCVSLILAKLAEDIEAAQYTNRGVTYTSQIPSLMRIAAPNTAVRNGQGRPSRAQVPLADGADVVSSTKITLSVPDSLVGNILGRQGSTLREIMSLSGAKVTVSNRDEAKTPDGQIENRTITITGSPTCAQTAHVYITQKLQQPSTSRPRRNGKSSAKSTSKGGVRDEEEVEVEDENDD